MSEYPAILGVFSLRRIDEVGTGATQSRHNQLTYWYARQLEQTLVELQPLNVYHVPSGIKKKSVLDDFLRAYTPEPRYYEANTVPALRSLKTKIDQGEKLFSMGLLDDAEKAFLKALMIDEMNVPANYGLGDVYTEQKDFLKLRKVLDVLMGLNDAFSNEYRQKLNTFGINLRKQGCLAESIEFFNKALEIQKDDEHIYFNLARAHFDKGELDKCLGNLNIAAALNPAFAEARKFIAYCEKMSPQCGVGSS
jgi:tetratricopeptide (TPR) repeat protein